MASSRDTLYLVRCQVAFSRDRSPIALGAVVLGWAGSHSYSSSFFNFGHFHDDQWPPRHQYGRACFHDDTGLVPPLPTPALDAATKAMAIGSGSCLFVCRRRIMGKNS